MKKILAIAGSNSSKSINFEFINYVKDLIDDHQVEVLDIRKWIVPIYSEDMDVDNFTPTEINELINTMPNYDGIIISVPEHNEGPPVFFKNITDWLSRRLENIISGKPLLLLGTTPGRRAAAYSRDYSERTLPRLGANVVANYGLPSFNHTMIDGELVPEEQKNLITALTIFLKSLE